MAGLCLLGRESIPTSVRVLGAWITSEEMEEVEICCAVSGRLRVQSVVQVYSVALELAGGWWVYLVV